MHYFKISVGYSVCIFVYCSKIVCGHDGETASTILAREWLYSNFPRRLDLFATIIAYPEAITSVCLSVLCHFIRSRIWSILIVGLRTSLISISCLICFTRPLNSEDVLCVSIKEELQVRGEELDALIAHILHDM